MTHPALALQRAILDALIAHQPLISMLGGSRVYDHVPSRLRPPYIVFGDATHSDWSTGTESGLEHFIQLNVWSREKGRKEALDISGHVRTIVTDMQPDLGDNTLVNATHEFTETSRDEETGLYLASVNLRCVTEPN